MMLELTELIIEQSRTVLVMFCAGVATETFWQIKTEGQRRTGIKVIKAAMEAVFWIISAFVISAFLYYSCFGKMTFTALLGLLTGLLLWKKILHGIINAESQKKKKNVH